MAAAVFVLALAVSPARAQSPENVAVIVNDASDDSRRIAEHYVRVRQIPSANVIRLTTSTEDSITRASYVATIEGPITEALARHGLQDRILYVVLTKGVPLRIAGTEGQQGTVSSVDSELTLLYRRMTGRTVPVTGRIANPYFLADQPVASARRFNHRDHDIYLVTRLTAFTADEAIALIDRGLKPSQSGTIVLDQRSGVFADSAGDRSLADAQRVLKESGHGDRVLLEATTDPATTNDGVLGYYSWGSNDPEHRRRTVGVKFQPGALAGMFVSRDARTFDEPPKEWLPTNELRTRAAIFRGGPQSLTADLIREGATGVIGHVSEHYLESAARPQVLFPAYLAGFNLAESFYLAVPHLGWQAVVVGDPLCSPFASGDAGNQQDPGVDPKTELPTFFSTRRLENARVQFKGVPADAVALFVLGETRFRRDNDEGARQALEEATKVAADFVEAQLQLALVFDRLKDRESAATRYREVLRLNSRSIVALNNLAYDLAVNQGDTKQALSLARRAYALAPGNLMVVDTLAWVEHLAGNSAEAARLLRAPTQRDTGNADVHVHAAIVFAAVGDLRQAEIQLDRAVKLQPEYEQRDDVAQLRTRLRRK
jgi:uncharacterized protein (TIGR03790 family)